MERLTEHAIEIEAVSVDREARMVRNVAFAGTVSANGYEYAADAFVEAVGGRLYEGRPVFLDHDIESPNRSTRDLAGTTENARFEGGRIRGDIRVLDNEAGNSFLSILEAKTDVGMSHVVMARRNSDGNIIEHIGRVLSVDAVMNPATTSSFAESHNSTKEPDMAEAITKDDLEAFGKSLLEGVQKQIKDIQKDVNDLLESKTDPNAGTGTDTVEAEEIRKAEAKRQSDIRGLFKRSKFAEHADKFCDDASKTVEDARKWLLDAMLKTETEPQIESSGDPGKGADPSAQHREDYRKNASHLSQMGVTEEMYVASALKN